MTYFYECSNNVDYANIRLYSKFGRLVGKPGVPPFYDGIIGKVPNEDNIGPRGDPWSDTQAPTEVILDTSYKSSYHSNEKESRPKTKFFSLLVYAGYPIL